MRFNTMDELKAWAREAAALDYKKHQVIHTDPDGTTWQADKNPYSTEGSRYEWQRGFDNAPHRAHETPAHDAWSTHYQRGRAMAELLSTTQEQQP